MSGTLDPKEPTNRDDSSLLTRGTLRSRVLKQLVLFVLLFACLECFSLCQLRRLGYETDGATAMRDPQRGWRMRSSGPTGPAVNEEGLRGPDVSTEVPVGEQRMLCIGGSVTFGTGVPEADSYPSQLEQLLKADGVSVSVINGGTPACSSYQFVGLLTELAPRYHPTIITVMCGFNESNAFPYRWLEPDTARGIFNGRPYSNATRALLYRSATYRYLIQLLRGQESAAPTVLDVPGVDGSTIRDETAALTNSVDNLMILEKYTRIHGLRLLLIEEAHRTEVADRLNPIGKTSRATHIVKRDEWLAFLIRLRDAHRALADRLDVPFMDMNDALHASGRDDNELFVEGGDPIHMTRMGNRIAADTIRRRLIELGWLHTK